MRGRRILIPLPSAGSVHRRRHPYYIRCTIIIALGLFLLLQLNNFSFSENHEHMLAEVSNVSVDAILAMIPPVLHKFLTLKTRNQTLIANILQNGSSLNGAVSLIDLYHPPNSSEIKRQIAKYNDVQSVLNEYTFGPLQNDSVIIVVQVHTRITYLRHLIVSLAQARDISKTLLIFSHDYYDEDINDLVQSIDFCKVMQIFYPHSIQTHPDEFPGVDPNDCPRDINKDQAILRKCNNAIYPDLYGHYREAKFTQTKHHWWWKANRVFDELEITKYHTGLVLFLEEDHYVAEDFLYVLTMMYKRTIDLCPQCNILSLGTYLKTFNYYTYNSKSKIKSYSNPYASTSLLINTNNFLENHHISKKSLQVSPSSSLLQQMSSSGNQKYFNRYYSFSNNDEWSSHNYYNNDNKRKISNSKADFVGDTNNLNSNQNLNTYGITSMIRNVSTINTINVPSITTIKTAKIITATSKSTSTKTTKSISTYLNNYYNYNSNYNNDNNNNKNIVQQTWSYHVLPSLYSIYQKVEVMPWISSKHNMGFAFNRTTWNSVKKCYKQFCSYDDYNWDWSLQHVSQQCMTGNKLYAMIVKGPRVFHIGECGVHHKKKNCESNQVISKVQKVLYIARKSGQIFPKTLTLTVASLNKKTKLRKGNGGWGDRRDHQLCINMTSQAIR